jgi:REP element-mobilizing transposase RayT
LDTIGAGPLLGDVIRGFTSRATRLDWETGRREFGWQERFYDHVIRNERSLDAIREYIWDNPRKWEMDSENPANAGRRAQAGAGRMLR